MKPSDTKKYSAKWVLLSLMVLLVSSFFILLYKGMGGSNHHPEETLSEMGPTAHEIKEESQRDHGVSEDSENAEDNIVQKPQIIEKDNPPHQTIKLEDADPIGADFYDRKKDGEALKVFIEDYIDLAKESDISARHYVGVAIEECVGKESLFGPSGSYRKAIESGEVDHPNPDSLFTPWTEDCEGFRAYEIPDNEILRDWQIESIQDGFAPAILRAKQDKAMIAEMVLGERGRSEVIEGSILTDEALDFLADTQHPALFDAALVNIQITSNSSGGSHTLVSDVRCELSSECSVRSNPRLRMECESMRDCDPDRTSIDSMRRLQMNDADYQAWRSRFEASQTGFRTGFHR